MNDLEELDLETAILTNVRTETASGKEYLVAEVVILKEGVLNGSDGPLYYSLPEISKRIGIWNGMPIVAPHPYIYVNGEMKHVSARTPGIADQFQIGTVFNDRLIKGERTVDLYFDIQKANKIDGRIISSIQSGQAINVSTGLSAPKKKAVANSNFRGTQYTHTVHNIEPDHLAILMDEKGACSVHDGCGINVNTSKKAWSNEEVETVVTYNRNWPKSKRDSALKEDFAGPHESFPIATQEDVNSAAKLTGHADDPETVKSKIKAIAKRKGLSVPESWTDKTTTNETGEDGQPMNELGDTTNNSDISNLSSKTGQADASVTAMCKEASHTAHESSRNAEGSSSDGFTHSMAYQHSRDALAATPGKDASTKHMMASKAHSKMAKEAMDDGSTYRAQNHMNAADKHMKAADVHKQLMTKGTRNSSGDNMETKGQLVSWLTVNCDCWKNDKTGSETVLNNLSEEQLKQLKINAVRSAQMPVAMSVLKDVAKTLNYSGDLSKLPGLVLNTVNRADGVPASVFGDNTASKEDKESPGMEDFGPIGQKGTRPNGGTRVVDELETSGGYQLPESGQLGVQNAVKKYFASMTDEDYIKLAPPGVRATLNTAKKVHDEKRISIINKLTSHITNSEERKQRILKLKDKSIIQLEELAEYAGVNNQSATSQPKNAEEAFLANFFGQSGGTNNQQQQPTFNRSNVLLPFMDPADEEIA